MPALRLARWIAVAALACACSKAPQPLPADGVARIDGTSDASLNASVDAMRRGMSHDEEKRFTDALVTIGASTVPDAMEQGGDPAVALSRALRERVHGMSLADVLSEGGVETVAGGPSRAR